MPRKKIETPTTEAPIKATTTQATTPVKKNDLVNIEEAAAILSAKAGREIKTGYVRVLASKRYGKLTPVPFDGRTNLYKRSELALITVSDKPGRKKREA